MLSRITRRAIASLLTVALAMIAVAGPVAASTPPPGGGGSSKCQSVDTGYLPRGYGAGNTGQGDFDARWVYDGTLRWKMCLESANGTTRFATAQLSADATEDYTYTLFYGEVIVKLQRCLFSGYDTVATLTTTGYDTGHLSTGRYRFDNLITQDTSSQSTQGFRITIQTYLGWVDDQHQTFVPIALSSDGPNGGAFVSTGCFDL